MRTFFRNIVIITASLFGLSCNKVKSYGPVEDAKAVASMTDLPKSKQLGLEILYDVQLRLTGWPNPCRGKATLRVDPNFSISFPETKQNVLSCFGFLEFSISDLLSGLKTNDKSPKGPNASHDGKMLYLKRLSKASFNPPRPFLLGPVITDEAKYKGYRKEVVTTATTDEGSFTGKFNVEVKKIGSKFVSPANRKMRFDNIIQWETKAEGFEGMNKLRGISFSKFGWLWNTKPIMIPKFYFELMASDILSDSQQVVASASDALFGKITVELNVISYDEEAAP